MRRPTVANSILYGVVGGLTAVVAAACRQAQTETVRDFNALAKPIQVACLDMNSDGRINGGDAVPTLPDITGDERTDDADFAVLQSVDFALAAGKPEGCEDEGSGPEPDWQVTEHPELDCSTGTKAVLLMAIGGGAVDLGNVTNAAGVRWMLTEIDAGLDAPTQMASVAPGLNGTTEKQPDSERWSVAYITSQLRIYPCLGVIILGHSHGGTHATAAATRLEEAGLANQVVLTVVIDRVTFAYFGDTVSVPQTSPVFDVFLAEPQEAGEHVAGAGLDQPNVENLNVTGMQAPEHGETGGEMKPVTHTTIDNSPDVLREIQLRVQAAVDRFVGGQ
jgi:hypothetical protein